MTKEERVNESIILFGLGKAFSEQATVLTGELKHKPKQTFNAAVKAIDLFIKTIEDNMTEGEKKYAEGVCDIYHNINLEIRKNK
jgi:hypothetical protein